MQYGYDSTTAFLQDRQLDHATDATHRFETGTGKMFAGLVDRRTREQDEFQDLANHVGRYQDERVKVMEFLSPTFTLHFEITIYNGERSNLQSLVKSMTQAMIGGESGMDGIWKMPEMKTFLYSMNFKTEAGEDGIYAQVVYPDVTVSKHQHTACLRMLRNKLGELKEVQEIVRKAPERNVPRPQFGIFFAVSFADFIRRQQQQQHRNVHIFYGTNCTQRRAANIGVTR